MKTKVRKTLPKTAAEILNGGIYSQRVRCGKKTCKCTRGELHSALYFFTRRNGKLVKSYIRKAEHMAFSRLVRQSSLDRKQKREALKIAASLSNRFRLNLCKYDRLINTLKERLEI